ncbi:hypothetical protein [Pseudalkalibacillus berkeleyi]|uniref:Uncharacterized protein n=1 Tax=Pseudalkalibacillus berkeleyi TaxID=1069813 RepID=A0ABS9H6C3_9BACL|nr:hypothetical protein [Pseudalkalibacillus berkeleyi]MCF6139417.1 hypothetical protein [Pseudalkalibacillus berkeleyi]
MNFEIFMGLVGVPIGIILTAIICYISLGRKDKAASVNTQSKEGISK